jgi:hypothetical protein
VAAIAGGIVLTAGCQEEQASPEEQARIAEIAEVKKQARLMAVENANLRKDIAEQKLRHAAELTKQKRQLDKCLREKTALVEASKVNIDELMNTALMMTAEENKRLLEENKSLKGQIEQLSKELEEAKKQTAGGSGG